MHKIGLENFKLRLKAGNAEKNMKKKKQME